MAIAAKCYCFGATFSASGLRVDACSDLLNDILVPWSVPDLHLAQQHSNLPPKPKHYHSDSFSDEKTPIHHRYCSVTVTNDVACKSFRLCCWQVLKSFYLHPHQSCSHWNRRTWGSYFRSSSPASNSESLYHDAPLFWCGRRLGVTWRVALWTRRPFVDCLGRLPEEANFTGDASLKLKHPLGHSKSHAVFVCCLLAAGDSTSTTNLDCRMGDYADYVDYAADSKR